MGIQLLGTESEILLRPSKEISKISWILGFRAPERGLTGRIRNGDSLKNHQLF